MTDYRSEKTRILKAYVPGEQPKDRSYIKLNTNESPYPPAPAVKAAIIAELDKNELALYPDPSASLLKEHIAAAEGTEPSRIFVGNGSDEVLAFCFPAFFEGGARVAFADITYSFYSVYCSLFGVQSKKIPLDEDFSLPVSEFCAGGFGGVLIANPNAPTGKVVGLTDIEGIALSNPNCVVVIDEAYIAFGGESALPLLDRCPNLLVVRTFSKAYSLAGMRVGYAIGGESLISALDTVKNSFNSYTINRLSIAAASAAISSPVYYKNIARRIIRTRERISEELRRLDFNVMPSGANFVFASHAELAASELAAELRLQGVLVRHFNTDRIDNFLRISIGTDKQMDKLLNVLKNITGRRME